MSTRELERVEVMGRVAKAGLKLGGAAVELSPGETVVATVSAGGQEWAEAWPCRSAVSAR